MTPAQLVSIHRRPKTSLAAAADRLSKLRTPTRENPLIISVSELRDFMRCRMKWAFRHQLRLEPQQGSEALSIGILTHSIIEQWYLHDARIRTPKKMERLAIDAVRASSLKALDTDARALVEAMTIGYAHWTLDENNERSDVNIGYVNGEPEEWFTISLDPKKDTILLRGKWDNRFVPTKMKSTVALLEMKTASKISMSKFDYNTQVMGYGCSLFDKFPRYKRRVIFPTVLRKQMPGPRVKADLFAREMIEPSREEVEIWRSDARRAALDMLDAAIYANPTDQCDWDCDFRGPCLLRGTPDDVKHVLKTEYQPKERT